MDAALARAKVGLAIGRGPSSLTELGHFARLPRQWANVGAESLVADGTLIKGVHRQTVMYAEKPGVPFSFAVGKLGGLNVNFNGAGAVPGSTVDIITGEADEADVATNATGTGTYAFGHSYTAAGTYMAIAASVAGQASATVTVP